MPLKAGGGFSTSLTTVLLESLLNRLIANFGIAVKNEITESITFAEEFTEEVTKGFDCEIFETAKCWKTEIIRTINIPNNKDSLEKYAIETVKEFP